MENEGVAAKPPLVSIIIPHYNDLKNLERCLALLEIQTFPRAEFEIIVADNNSECGFESVRDACQERARVVHAPRQGAGEARNAGIAASQGTILGFIDSDCRPAADWIERGVAAISRGEMVGGSVHLDVTDANRMTPVEAFEKVFAFRFDRYIAKENFAGAGNMFVLRRVFDDVGPFRAHVSEDKEWGQRAAAKGYQWLYAPDVLVAHPARRDWRQMTIKWERVQRELYLLAREHPFGRWIWLFRAFVVLFSPIPHVITVLFSPKLQHARDRVGAIKILFLIRVWRFANCIKCLVKTERRGAHPATQVRKRCTLP